LPELEPPLVKLDAVAVAQQERESDESTDLVPDVVTDYSTGGSRGNDAKILSSWLVPA
jgi:hypothetical protein